jgi:hypothetical protein
VAGAPPRIRHVQWSTFDDIGAPASEHVDVWRQLLLPVEVASRIRRRSNRSGAARIGHAVFARRPPPSECPVAPRSCRLRRRAAPATASPIGSVSNRRTLPASVRSGRRPRIDPRDR